MVINETIVRELVKRGYSERDNVRVWDVSDSKLWYLTPDSLKGFLKLNKFEPYRKNVLEREMNLLKENAVKIYEKFGKKKFNLIVFGGGSGEKAEAFISELSDNAKIRFVAIDFNKYFTENSVERIKKLNSKKIVETKEFVSCFENFDNLVSMLRSGEFQNNLILILGETISHHEINEFLYEISNCMFSGDMAVFANGVRVGERFVEIEKYKQPIFNNWFVHIMKGLGFEEKEVEYDARFTETRLEGYYKIKVDKEIQFKGKKIKFREGDEVIVAVQYKFFAPELKKFCKKYFRKVEIATDVQGEYALSVCKK